MHQITLEAYDIKLDIYLHVVKPVGPLAFKAKGPNSFKSTLIVFSSFSFFVLFFGFFGVVFVR